MGRRKDSVSLNARIGPDAFRILEEFCEVTGQPKTVAVERAIRAYCGTPSDVPGPQDAGTGEEGGT